jgi:hypothetical protein
MINAKQPLYAGLTIERLLSPGPCIGSEDSCCARFIYALTYVRPGALVGFIMLISKLYVPIFFICPSSAGASSQPIALGRAANSASAGIRTSVSGEPIGSQSVRTSNVMSHFASTSYIRRGMLSSASPAGADSTSEFHEEEHSRKKLIEGDHTIETRRDVQDGNGVEVTEECDHEKCKQQSHPISNPGEPPAIADGRLAHADY